MYSRTWSELVRTYPNLVLSSLLVYLDSVPEPPEPPDGPAQRENGPPSTQLKGEWNVAASCDVRRTSSHTDMPGVSKGDEDPRNRPTGAQNVSEQERERSTGGVQKTHLREVETTEAVQAVKRTPQECQGTSRTSGSG